MENTGTNSVLSKAVLILRAFTHDDHVVPLAHLVARTGLHKATVHRLSKELVELGLLERTAGGYRLAGGLFELGMRASVERSLLEVATPFLQAMAERTHELVHLAVREGSEVVYIAKLGGHQQARSPSRIGGRMPLHCTAVGKVLLAYDEELRRSVLAGPLPRRTSHTVVAPGMLRRQLDRVVELGVAFEHEESALGLTCIACPVFDHEDQPVAAVSVTGPTTRFRPASHENSLRATTTALSATLARRRHLESRSEAPPTSPTHP